jgi:uncharacterized protein (TIGR03437 family)
MYGLIAVFTLAPALFAAPRLALSTVAVGPVFTNPGTSPNPQTVEAFNAGDGSLNLSTTSSSSWLSASLGAQRPCTTRTGTCTPIVITFATSGLAAGTFTEYITVTDPNAVDTPVDISVTVTVAGVPDSVTFYATPRGGTRPTVLATVYVSSTVTGTPTTQTGGGWLSFGVGSAASMNFLLPYNIQAAAQPGQAPGTYQGSMAITGSRVPAENKTVAVTLNVTCSPILAIDNATIRLNGVAGGPIQYAPISFANLADGTGAGAGCPSNPLAVTGATATSTTSGFLTASTAGSSGILIGADPSKLAAGTYSGTVTITSNAANNTQVSIPVQFSVSAAGKPLISTGGVINIANYAHEAVSPGDIVAIFGSQLSNTTATNPGLPPLATTLGASQVLLNGVPAPLYYVSPGQVNFQIPYSVTDTVTVQVVNGGIPGNARSVGITSRAPRFLIWPASLASGGYAIAVNADGSLPLPSGTKVPGYTSHPAKPGDTIVIYGVGFGQTSPAAVEGAAANTSPLQTIPGTIPVTFGGGFQGRPTSGNASYVGLTPTAVGLYQVNIKLPDDIPLGALVPVTATINGVPTALAYIAASASGQ